VHAIPANERGLFTLSFDFELIWGTLDHSGPEGFRRQCEREREVVIDRTLALLAELQVPATWFVLGHLMLDRCSQVEGVKHPEIVRPRHAWVAGDWFEHDPASTENGAPTFYGRSLVEKIRACTVAQEIGCHSFSHVIFGDAGCSRETAESELAASLSAARQLGLTPTSFAFPRNSVGHLDVLARHGFRCFRGPEPRWYNGWPHAVHRTGHLVDVLTASEPPVAWPRQVAPALWDVPGSMVYVPMHGVRRFIPVSRRVQRAIKGLNAARRGGLFHLWTHPTNLVDGMEPMMKGLRDILTYAARLRDAGELRFVTVGEAAELAAQRALAG
jgi:peptidoglycan/xylan/chitin deacetylase (PgdA/CDA1 family)